MNVRGEFKPGGILSERGFQKPEDLNKIIAEVFVNVHFPELGPDLTILALTPNIGLDLLADIEIPIFSILGPPEQLLDAVETEPIGVIGVEDINTYGTRDNPINLKNMAQLIQGLGIPFQMLLNPRNREAILTRIKDQFGESSSEYKMLEKTDLQTLGLLYDTEGFVIFPRIANHPNAHDILQIGPRDSSFVCYDHAIFGDNYDSVTIHPRFGSQSVKKFLQRAVNRTIQGARNKTDGKFVVYYDSRDNIPHVAIKDGQGPLYCHKMGDGCMLLCDPDLLLGGLYVVPADYYKKS